MSFHRSSRGAPASGAEGGQIVQQQPQTQTISTNNCRKIFAQRDYSEDPILSADCVQCRMKFSGDLNI